MSRGGAGAVMAMAAMLWAAAPMAAQAGVQVPGALGIEAWGGAAIGSFEPTGAGMELAPGAAWGVSASWGPTERLGGYVAYSSLPFRCEGGLCQGYDVSLAPRGVSLGLRGQTPGAEGAWLQAGLLLHGFRQEWSGPEGRERVGTDTRPGLEAAGGLGWGIGGGVTLVAGAHLGLLPTVAPDGVTERVLFSAARIGLRLGL